jgi:hypothetical protein
VVDDVCSMYNMCEGRIADDKIGSLSAIRLIHTPSGGNGSNGNALEFIGLYYIFAVSRGFFPLANTNVVMPIER